MQAEPAQHANEAEPGFRRSSRKAKAVDRFDPPAWWNLRQAAAAVTKPSEEPCDEDSDSDEEDDAQPCAAI